MSQLLSLQQAHGELQHMQVQVKSAYESAACRMMKDCSSTSSKSAVYHVIPARPYLGVEVKGSKNIVVTVETQAINARHLAVSVIVIKHKDVQRCAAC